MVTCPVFSRFKGVLTSAMLCGLLLPSAQGQEFQAQVIAVNSDTFSTPDTPTQRCLPSLISSHEKALRDNTSTSWALRYAPVAVGLVLGGAAGLKVADHYRLGLKPRKFQKWERPAAGVIGAAAVGLLGWWVSQQLFAEDPSEQTPEAGVPMSEQSFLTETTCAPMSILTSVSSPHYLVTYHHAGHNHTARVRHYPGPSIAVTREGRPVDEVTDDTR
jgi:uncharacterized protein YcfJ